MEIRYEFIEIAITFIFLFAYFKKNDIFTNLILDNKT